MKKQTFKNALTTKGFRFSKVLPAAAFLLALGVTVSSCRKDDEEHDSNPQEEISNIVLKVTNDANGAVKTYNYSANSSTMPSISLANGQTYTVETSFMNGTQDVTAEIRNEKDAHFIIFDMYQNNISLQRLDQEVRQDGKRVGLKTKWNVQSVAAAPGNRISVKLIHAATAVNEDKTGTAWGSTTGGETDAQANYQTSN